MEISSLLFYLFSFIILGSAMMVVFSSNLVHSALYLVVSFIGVACIFLLLNADFLALVQLLVYVGAISVLLVFGVMLTRRGDIRTSNLFNRYRFFGGLISVALFLVIGRFLFFEQWIGINPAQTPLTIERISEVLLNDYVIPFEASGVLLLIAMIGAILIGKGAGNPK
jgi:NADH:ubiquinone oxidoreductase subunit 6 (subunit J)